MIEAKSEAPDATPGDDADVAGDASMDEEFGTPHAADAPPAATSPPPLPAAVPVDRGVEGHPEVVRHAAAAFNARVTGVVRKNRGG